MIKLLPIEGTRSHSLSARHDRSLLTAVNTIRGGKTQSKSSKQNHKKDKRNTEPKSKENKLKNDESMEDEGDEESASKDTEISSSLSSVLSFTTDRISDLKTLTFKAAKVSGKKVIDLVSNKHVTASQVVGKWKLSQDINIRPGVSITFPASIEFFEDGTLKTKFEGKDYVSSYKFVEQSWPLRCSIEFDARACVIGNDPEPVSLSYKGYFKRSIMNPRVIFVRGKIYKTSGNTL